MNATAPSAWVTVDEAVMLAEHRTGLATLKAALMGAIERGVIRQRHGADDGLPRLNLNPRGNSVDNQGRPLVTVNARGERQYATLVRVADVEAWLAALLGKSTPKAPRRKPSQMKALKALTALGDTSGDTDKALQSRVETWCKENNERPPFPSLSVVKRLRSTLGH